MKKTLILILSILFIFTTSIYNSYGEQFWYKPEYISAYKHPLSDKIKLFEGNTKDTICFDSDNMTILLYCRDEIKRFKIHYLNVIDDNYKIEFFTIDENNDEVYISTRSMNNNKTVIITISYPYGVVFYFVNLTNK
jgi:hypothetical protein